MIKSYFIYLLSIGLSFSLYAKSSNIITDENGNRVIGDNNLYCSTENKSASDDYNKAVDLVLQRKIKEAITLYQSALKKDPDFCDAMDNLGQLLRTQGKIEQAISWYKKSILLNPDNPVVRVNLAVTYIIKKEYENALAEYQQLKRIQPNDPEVDYGIAQVFNAQKQFKKAIQSFEKAKKIYLKQKSPLVVDADLGIAIGFYSLEQYKTALTYFEPAYLAKKNIPEINYMMGIAYLETNQKEKARIYIGEAQKLGMKIHPKLAEILGLNKE